MSETLGPEDEAIKFNLEEADKRFCESLSTAKNGEQDGEQVREAIGNLINDYSSVGNSTERLITYIPKFIKTLQKLRDVPKKLINKKDSFDYDAVLALIAEGLPDEFIEQHGKEASQWHEAINQLFTAIGVIEDDSAKLTADKKAAEEKEARKNEMEKHLEPIEKLLGMDKMVTIAAWSNGEDLSWLEVIIKIANPDSDNKKKYTFELKIYWKQTGPDAGTLKIYRGQTSEVLTPSEDQVLPEIESIIEEYYSEKPL